MKQRLQLPKRLNNNVLLLLLTLFVGGVVLSACSESQKPSVQPVATASKQIQQPVTQVTSTVMEEKTVQVFVYSPQGRRDPFAPLISKEDIKIRAGSRPPLERYSISEFKLTGIVWGGFGYNAMVEGPDGKGFFIRKGTTIGPNKGIVKEITKDTLKIEEKFKNMLGETERKQITIQIRKKQEGMQ